MLLHLGHLFAHELLHLFQQRLLHVVVEGEGHAIVTRAAGPADAVDIGLGHFGQVVVEHAGHILDVQATGGNVGGHQHPDLSGFEVGQGGLPGSLRLVAVDGGGGDPRSVQVTAHLVRAVLGAGEDQGGGDVLLLQDPDHQFGLVLPVHRPSRLLDDLHRGGHRVHSHPCRVV